MAHHAMSEFNSSEYAPPRCGLEVQEEDGCWRQATVYTHTAHSNVVLWYSLFEHAVFDFAPAHVWHASANLRRFGFGSAPSVRMMA